MPLLLVTELVKNTEVRENNLSPPKGGFFYVLNKFLVCFYALERFSMGKHLLLEVYDIKYELLNDGIALQEVMERGINRAGMTILNIYQHCFIPQGVTIVIALSESHVSCHTWPEEGAIAIDVYTCGEGNPKLIALELLKYLNSNNFRLKEIDR